MVGPTGRFPQGKLNENDEGELRIDVARKKATKSLRSCDAKETN